MPIRRTAFLLLVLLSSIVNSCDNKSTGPTDTTRPSAITNLAIDGISGGKILFSWTASGDDGKSGTASYYDLRSASDSNTLMNWGGAQQVQGEPVPAVYSTPESVLVSDTYARPRFFALKVSDESANTSPLSNIVCLCQ